VSSQSQISIPELQAFAPSAIVFAVGAQGPKSWTAGESAKGVYAAKISYTTTTCCRLHFSDFSVGKRVAVVGMARDGGYRSLAPDR